MKAKPFPYKYLFYLLVFAVVFSCGEDHPQKTQEPIMNDSISANKKSDSIDISEEKKITPLVIKYQLDSIFENRTYDSIFRNYSEEQKKIIFAINRIEPVRVREGSKLVIPDTLLSDFNSYAPFPRLLSSLDSIPKVVLISQRVQAFGLYEKGELIRWGPVSSGKQSTPTPNGLHYGNYKAKRKVSTVNKAWILPYYFNFMNFEGVGVHQYLLPGFPASHACVRLYMEDAKFIYDWARQWKLDASGGEVVKNGTPFMVFGEYDYKNPFPWFELAQNPEANLISNEEKKIIAKYVEEYFQDERNFIETEKDSVETGIQ